MGALRLLSFPRKHNQLLPLPLTVQQLATTRSVSTSTTSSSSSDNTRKTSSTDDKDDMPIKKVKPKLPRKTQLKTDLKQYRLQQATPLNQPPYRVFTNAVLEEIYARLPTTHEELLQCKGIGPKKLDLYGDDILSIVAPYTARGAPPQAQSQAAKLTTTIPKKPIITKKSLTKEQRRACDMLLMPTLPNGFITGSAGTGKSYALKYLVQELQRRSIKVGVCAPTGVAAIHVSGNTLHSFFGIGLGKGSLSTLMKKVLGNPLAMQRIDETDVLIIDECSMLSSNLLETLDTIVRQIRREGQFTDLPFGGMQVICFGDFFQLPPVVPGQYNDANDNNNDKPFCFLSPIWEELGLTQNMIQLHEIQRQQTDHDAGEFVTLLNKIRIGDVCEGDIQQLNQRCVVDRNNHPLPNDGIVPTRLYSLNKDVDAENEARLAELPGPEIICRATDSWRQPMPMGTLASVKKQMALSLSKEMPDEVRLRVGAQVMLTRNKDLGRDLVNGSRGVVLRFEKENNKKSVKDKNNDDNNNDNDTTTTTTAMIPVVRFDCGVVTSIPPVEAVRYNPDGQQQQPGCLVRSQVPLKLAWALTVHKSQGTTLTRAILDISSAFEYGQCYVALSRVRSLDGLWLVKPAQLHNIKVSPQVLDYYHYNNQHNCDNDRDVTP